MGSLEEKFKREFFCSFVDTALVSIEEMFGQMKYHEKTRGTLYDLSKLPVDRKTLLNNCTDLHQMLTHGERSGINDKDLYVKLDNIHYILHNGKHSPLQVLQFIHDAEWKDTFPNVWIALRILLMLSVTVTSGERGFSTLRLIKTYLQSMMANERLTSLAILLFENAISQSLDLSDASLQFVRSRVRKMTFLN